MTPPLERIAAGRTDLAVEGLGEDGAAFVTEALRWCAYYGDVSALRHLLAKGGSLDVLGHDRGLNAAAFHGHWQLCEFLLEHGAEVNRALPETGETALHAALTHEDRQRYDLTVKVLLAAGADPNRATPPPLLRRVQDSPGPRRSARESPGIAHEEPLVR